MENTSAVAGTMSKLQDLNIQMHMDDFGTGYSSLSYLHQFPFQTLKIDRRFVRDLGTRREADKIVRTIVSLAADLGMQVTAEGIESLQQLRELQALGCDYGQGYYFSPPVEAERAEAFVAQPGFWPSLISRKLRATAPAAAHVR